MELYGQNIWFFCNVRNEFQTWLRSWLPEIWTELLYNYEASKTLCINIGSLIPKTFRKLLQFVSPCLDLDLFYLYSICLLCIYFALCLDETKMNIFSGKNYSWLWTIMPLQFSIIIESVIESVDTNSGYSNATQLWLFWWIYDIDILKRAASWQLLIMMW